MLTILGLYNYDPSIFDGLTVPLNDENEPLFDKDTLIGIILSQNAELSLVYSKPETMKDMISYWSNASQYSWATLAKTMFFDYNPIWNKDGTITETESGGSGSSAEESVSAYNSSNYEPRAKNVGQVASSRSFERTEQGNIGVTSTQQLIAEERETAMFNIYDRISEDFRSRFCIMVY